MIKHLLRRLVACFFVLIGVSLVAFALVRLDGSDPARLIAGDLATEEEIEDYRVRMGLDKPVIEQYFMYIRDIFKGNLGYSWSFNMNVTELFATRIPQTLQLSIAALIWSCVFSIIFGVIAGIHQGSGIDFAALFFAVVGQAMSTVWLAFMLILLFGVKLNWLPIQGIGGLKHMIMPTLCMGFGTAASQTRLMRSSMVDVLREDYISATRARGISKNKTYFKYALKNAILPVVTNIGQRVGHLIAGAVVIENVFNWPGMGQLMVTAINQRDYQLVQSIMLVSATLLVFCNVLVDIVYTLIDPRIKFN